MRRLLLVLPLVLMGCAKSEVTEADAAANKAAFSQDAYEDAMKKAGKGAELEAEKARAADRDAGQR